MCSASILQVLLWEIEGGDSRIPGNSWAKEADVHIHTLNIHILRVYTCAPKSARKAVHLELKVEEQNVEEVRQPVTAGF